MIFKFVDKSLRDTAFLVHHECRCNLDVGETEETFFQDVVGSLDQQSVEEVQFLDAVRTNSVLAAFERGAAVETSAVDGSIAETVEEIGD